MTTTLTEAGAPGPAATSVPLLRSTVRHSGPRCTALALVSLAATGANLLLPVALGGALDLLLAGDPDGSRRVLWCTGLILAVAALDAVETVLGGTTDARATAWLRHRLVGHVLAAGPRAVARFGPGTWWPGSSGTRPRRERHPPRSPRFSPRSPGRWARWWHWDSSTRGSPRCS